MVRKCLLVAAGLAKAALSTGLSWLSVATLQGAKELVGFLPRVVARKAGPVSLILRLQHPGSSMASVRRRLNMVQTPQKPEGRRLDGRLNGAPPSAQQAQATWPSSPSALPPTRRPSTRADARLTRRRAVLQTWMQYVMAFTDCGGTQGRRPSGQHKGGAAGAQLSSNAWHHP